MDKMLERKNKILEFMKESAYKPLKFEELAMVLDVPGEDRDKLAEILSSLEQEGAIYKTNKDRYGIPEKMNLVVGRLHGSDRGYGFLIPDDEDKEDIFIPAAAMAGAMHNDRVIARITSKGGDGRSTEGEIIKILKRAVSEVVGTFEQSRYFGFVVPDNKKIPGDVFIPKDEINGARPGQKVVAEIVKWPDGRRNAEGKIVEIIGDAGQPGVDILSIIRAHNLPESFPYEVMKQAESIPDKVTPEMTKGRQDLRKLRIVTIDGEDAKDLDDAVSIEKLPDGCYRLGVHIADVSYYVSENSPLDREALRRGTSVYLVDRVIPMLPPKLSNGVCSLNPGVDRLAFTVMMDIDSNGKVLRHDIFESVIKTAERMTYTDVYRILEEGDKELTERYSHVAEDLRTMKELALILRSKRMARGAIDFDFDEAKVIVDENGKPIDVKRYELTIANRIIEEFMLVCNETVAEHFHWTGMPFVFRIHEEPDSEKILTFAEFAKNLGYPVKGVNHIHPGALQDVLERVKGSKEEMIVSTVMLRSMAKARYSPENTGHFGLAARFYCHFTSPIRRYPDLIIHRLMKEELKGELSDERTQELAEALPEIAKICSDRERAADEAERDTEDLKKVEFMKEKVGEIFEGVISNVTSFGMFVELENTIEGLVRVSSMYDDYYIFDDKHYTLRGERTGKQYRIGDTVKVLLARADVQTRQIDFVLADQAESDADNGRHERRSKNGHEQRNINHHGDGLVKNGKRHNDGDKTDNSEQGTDTREGSGESGKVSRSKKVKGISVKQPKQIEEIIKTRKPKKLKNTGKSAGSGQPKKPKKLK